jgi:dienelactone hydrolase
MSIELRRETVQYRDGANQLEGFVVTPQSDALRPVVLICHAWRGTEEFDRERAEWIASLGYIGFAIDVYGKGRRGTDNASCAALMNPFIEDRALLRRRLLASVAYASTMHGADPTRICAIGFCFGGLCALDLARANAPGLVGAIAYHGLFTPPNLGVQSPMQSKVIAYHGWDDPMATPDAVLAFATEMTAARADWQLHAFGGTLHAFTNPQANDPSFGVQYRAIAAQRTYQGSEAFFREVFGE